MKLSPLCTWAGLVFCCFFAGCADFDRKFDEALYGSVEEADAVRARNEAQAQNAFAKNIGRFETETLHIINGERKKYKSPVATSSEELQNAARTRVLEVAELYSDRRPNGQDFSTIFKEHGIDRFDNSFLKGRPRGSLFRELRACGPKKPIEVFNYWLSRPADRKVLLKADMRRMAVATCLKDNKIYWVLLAYM